MPASRTLSSAAGATQSSMAPLESKTTLVTLELHEHPQLLPTLRKWSIAITLLLTALCATCLSLMWLMASDNIMAHFHVGHTAATLGITMYIFGLGSGPMFLGPILEFHGRKITYILGLLLSFATQFITAFANNFGAMLFGRFLSGFCISAFMLVAGGSFTDMFDKDSIGMPMMMFTLLPFLGPALGPLFSGFINENVDFRWTFYVGIIWTFAMLALNLAVVPETYVPVLESQKARRLSKQHPGTPFVLRLDETPHSLLDSTVLSARRPFGLLARDPMMFTLCFFTGLNLAITYLFFVAFPYIFRTVYRFGLPAQGMLFLGFIVGMLVAAPTGKINDKVYHRLCAHYGTARPEFRFPLLILGALIQPVGLFIIAWSAYPHCHWIGAEVGAAIYGIAACLVFNGVFSYLVDAYREYTASAMAANSFLRLLMAGVFPLFGLQMYERLDVHWATSLLAFISVALVPFPFLFFQYGERFRARSPYARSE